MFLGGPNKVNVIAPSALLRVSCLKTPLDSRSLECEITYNKSLKTNEKTHKCCNLDTILFDKSIVAQKRFAKAKET